MGRRRWTSDQCFFVTPVGSSRHRPGCQFGCNPFPDPLVPLRLRGPNLPPDLVLRLRHCGQDNRPSTTYVPQLRPSTPCSSRYRSRSHWRVRSSLLSVTSGIAERSSLVRDIVCTIWPHSVLSAPCDCNSTREPVCRRRTGQVFCRTQN